MPELLAGGPVREKIKEIASRLGITLPIGPTPFNIRDKIWA